MDVTPEKISHFFVRYSEGDNEAFSFFYKYFINDMYAYGRSLGVDEKYVMDAVQDVFLDLFFKKPRFQSVDHFRYFLLKSLKNRLYDLFKSRYFSGTVELEKETLHFSIKTTVLDDIIKEEDRLIVLQKIERLLSVLTSLQKEAVYLRYVHELDYRQIAEIMQKNEPAVRKLVSQGIKKIRRINRGTPSAAFMLSLCDLFSLHLIC